MQVDETGHEIEIETIYQNVKDEKKWFGYQAKCKKCAAKTPVHSGMLNNMEHTLESCIDTINMYPCIHDSKIEPTEPCEYCENEKPLFKWYNGAERRFIIQDGKFKMIEDGMFQPFPPWITLMEFSINVCPICGKEIECK